MSDHPSLSGGSPPATDANGTTATPAGHLISHPPTAAASICPTNPRLSGSLSPAAPVAQPATVPTDAQLPPPDASEAMYVIFLDSLPEGSYPRQLVCPISQEVMLDPVIAADGFTYERVMIEGWFRSLTRQRVPITSPNTRERLSSLTLVPNRQIRSLIRDTIEDMSRSMV